MMLHEFCLSLTQFAIDCQCTNWSFKIIYRDDGTPIIRFDVYSTSDRPAINAHLLAYVNDLGSKDEDYARDKFIELAIAAAEAGWASLADSLGLELILDT